jgi:hypothetical protein
LLDFLRHYPSSSQMYQDVETRMFSSASGRKKGDVDMKHVVLEGSQGILLN